jgi:hypothetical protein
MNSKLGPVSFGKTMGCLALELFLFLPNPIAFRIAIVLATEDI